MKSATRKVFMAMGWQSSSDLPKTECKREIKSIAFLVQKSLALVKNGAVRDSIDVQFRANCHAGIFCDEAQIIVAVVILLKQFMNGECGDSRKWVGVNLFEENAGVVVQISSSGGMIPAEIQSKLLSPVCSLSLVGEGAGFDLFAVREILDVHGAEVSLGNRDGQFCLDIFFPYAKL